MLRSSSSARISPAAAPAESCVRTRRTAWSERMGERVFDGLKVIDCASFIAGPAAATVMSDFGAEVVKVEPPGMGDPYRRRATPSPGPGLEGKPRLRARWPQQKEPCARPPHAGRASGAARAGCRRRRVHHELSAASPPAPQDHLRGSGAAQRAADLRLVQWLWRDRARGRQAWL